MSDWTPGPWEARLTSYGTWELWGDAESGPDRKMMGELECDSATARLVAAAPEMAELLRRLVVRDETWDIRDFPDCYIEARALLARINGETGK